MAIKIEDLGADAQRQAMEKYIERIREHKSAPAPSKPSKFHNVKTTQRGIRFDSKKEAARYEELLLMEQAGAIRDLRLQVDFTLQEAYTTPDGRRVQAIRYRADFTYEEQTSFHTEFSEKVPGWQKVVEDVKSRGTRTKLYINKQKMMHDKFGITIREV